MSALIGIALCGFVVGVLYLMFDSTKSQRRVNEYICLYKIGRILQIAKEKDMNLMNIKAEDKQFFATNHTLDDAIESKLRDEIATIDTKGKQSKKNKDSK